VHIEPSYCCSRTEKRPAGTDRSRTFASITADTLFRRLTPMFWARSLEARIGAASFDRVTDLAKTPAPRS
jgi:hypothetical protein